MTDAVAVLDAHGRVLYHNPAAQAAAQHATGQERTIEEIEATPADRARTLDLRDTAGQPVPSDQVPTARLLRGEVLTGDNALTLQLGPHDDRARTMSFTGGPLRDGTGQIVGAVQIARDVTELQRAQTALAEQAAELEAIFESQADGVAVYDLQGRFVRANAALRQLFGFDADPEYTARPLDERAQRLLLFDEQGQLLSPEQWPHWRVLRGEILAGATALEGRVRTVDGRELWISTTGAPMHGPDGQVRGTVLITRDVTARRALERQASEQAAEQAAAAERTRLAHELHDTVTQEIYSAGLLADSITRNWQEHRADTEAALAQLPRLIRGALAGLRVLLLELRPTTLDELPLATLLRQLAEAMSSRAQAPIAVHLQLSGRSGSASADTEREAALDGTDAAPVEAVEPALPPAVKEVFYRVAQEALMNAAKYARARTIRVHLRTRDADKVTGLGKGRGKSLQGKGTHSTQSTIELEIADDGRGFDPSVVQAGHFGLAIMRERAQAVGATVRVRSQPGQGTRIVAAWRTGAEVGPQRSPGDRSPGSTRRGAPHG
jgi:signal transduction histidine kinase